MLSAAARAVRALGFDARAIYQRLSAASIAAAVREQGLRPMIERLRDAVPNLRDQCTGALDEDERRPRWEIKLRGLHPFQVVATLAALECVGGENRMIADIGDSSAITRPISEPWRARARWGGS